MRSKTYAAVLAVLFGLVFGRAHSEMSRATQADSGGAVLLSTLMQASMRSESGEDLGRLEDFIIDAESGAIEYVVVIPTGFLGIGERRVPVPWHSIDPHLPADLVVSVDRETLKAAPATDRAYSQVLDKKYVAGVNRFFENVNAMGAAEAP